MALSEQDLQAFNDQLATVMHAHPELADLAQRVQGGRTAASSMIPFIQALNKYGIDLPPNTQWDQASQSFVNHASGWKMALAGLIGAATLGVAGPAIVSSLGASGAAAPAAHAIYDTTTLYGGAAAPTAAATTTAAAGVLSKLKDALPFAGKAIGAATASAGATQYANNQLEADASQINERAQQDYQSNLQNLSGQEREQRASDLTNLARQSFLTSGRASPFNPSGAPVQSPSYLEGLSDIEKQALVRLKSDPMYDPMKIAPKKPTPYVPNTQMSGLQKAGNIAAPVLTTLGELYKPKPTVSIADALAPYLRFL